SVATTARIIWLALPDPGPNGALVIAAVLVAVAALLARAIRQPWRRGPLLGVGACGVLVAGLAAGAAGHAAAVGLRTLLGGDLSRWPPPIELAGLTWAPPVALILLAVTAAAVLPRRQHTRFPQAAAVSAGLTVCAVVGLAASFGLPWWAP